VTSRPRQSTARPGLESGRAARAGRWFVRPATALILVLGIFPLLFSLGLTFTNVNLFRRGPVEFVGLRNWDRLLSDEALRTTLLNSVVFVVAGVLLQYVIGLLLAVVLNQGFRGQRPMRVLILLPMMVSPIAVGFIIGRMMLSEGFGPVNDLLQMIGLPAVAWVSTTWLARLTIVLVDSWQWTAFMMLVLLAALQNIPEEPLQAARVDGASEWQTFKYVVFPLLVPASVTAVLIRGLEAFKIIDIIRVVTGGGPGRATESVTMYVYNVGSKQGDVAYAAAAAYALMILVILFSLLMLFGLRPITRRYAP